MGRVRREIFQVGNFPEAKCSGGDNPGEGAVQKPYPTISFAMETAQGLIAVSENIY